MDGILGKIGSILRISTKSDSTNNRSFRARDIRSNEGPVTVDQSINPTIVMSDSEESDGKRRRRDAAEKVWNAFLELKHNEITAVWIMDIVQPISDMSDLHKNSYFSSALKVLRTQGMERLIQKYVQPGREIERHRSHISDSLWELFKAYELLTVRPALLLLDPKTEVAATSWWNDTIISKTLNGQSMPQNLNQLAQMQEIPLTLCKNALEKQILLEVQSVG
jgi:hypothetical protein